MQKLSLKSMVMLCKSCRVIHQEPTKLSLHFSDFSRIFYEFYKIHPNTQYYSRLNFQEGPDKNFNLHRSTPGLHKDPYE
jgi:hypothetical protein